MPKIEYIEKKFTQVTLNLITQANEIIDEYDDEGMSLTLRQLYYQFVSRDLIQNKQSEYKRLGSIISDARLAGLVDWEAIEDRTRNLQMNYHNTNPGQAVQDSLDQFLLNKWLDQPYRPEIWIEKEALTGVIGQICRSLDVPFFACKGYTSQSEMWRAAERFYSYIEDGQQPVIIHLGDHDPSGIDMTRDINDRHNIFISKYTLDASVKIVRIALNYDQVEEYDPPPNPAKLTDTRADKYVKEYGDSSWELDALEPRVIRDLIRDTVDEFIDHDLMQATKDQEAKYRKVLENVVENWQTL